MRGFEAQGREVYGIDLSRNFFEMHDAVSWSYRDGSGVMGPADVLININAPYLKYVFHLLGARFLRRKFVTAYWAWELPRAPDAWREGFARAHRVAVPSRFVADALRQLDADADIVVAMHPVALEEKPPTVAASADRFTVASSFNIASGFERKNPLALIEAFRIASKGRDWRLRLHASGAEHYPEGAQRLLQAVGGDPSIELNLGALDRAAYWRWLGRPHLFASLHRAEGFGLGLAEAMHLGIPVLATNWSANAEYMNEQNSLPVRFRLVPVVDPQRKYDQSEEFWAEPETEHAASLMRRACDEPAWLARIAAAGARDAARMFTQFAL